MSQYSKTVSVRWADLDPNFHLRHSVYYDFGASVRMQFLEEHGLDSTVLMQLGVGPILFREECVFKREIRMGDEVSINVQVLRSRKDYSRWSIQHQIFKNGDTLAAILTVEGAWMDVRKRKLTIPPPIAADVFNHIPRAENFVWEETQ